MRGMEARLSGRFWTVGAGERLANDYVELPSEGQDATEDARWPVWRELGGRWGSWWVRLAGRLQTAAVRLGVEWLAVEPGRH